MPVRVGRHLQLLIHQKSTPHKAHIEKNANNIRCFASMAPSFAGNNSVMIITLRRKYPNEHD